MNSLTAIYLAIFTLIALFLGRMLSLTSKKILNVSTFFCAILIILNAFLNFNPDFEYKHLDYSFYSYIRRWWVIPFAIYLFAVGERVAKNTIARLGALLFASLLLLFTAISIYLTFCNDYQYLGQPNKNGFCSQTTGISCGAAAAATYLSMKGCRTSEKEMAELCNTNPITGTSEFEIIRAIRLKLPGKDGKYQIGNLNLKQLDDCTIPLMTVVRFNDFIDHWVVVIQVMNDSIKFFDPLKGIKEISKDEFLKEWKFASIYFEPARE